LSLHFTQHLDFLFHWLDKLYVLNRHQFRFAITQNYDVSVLPVDPKNKVTVLGTSQHGYQVRKRGHDAVLFFSHRESFALVLICLSGL
ncbi:hypothetical protein, partial [Klebsiella pneumoniae]|uniref:hypothetical protein n=1 Tax=Klebsiella pneumoniae TaxID=573 RepID=UPI002731D51B